MYRMHCVFEFVIEYWICTLINLFRHFLTLVEYISLWAAQTDLYKSKETLISEKRLLHVEMVPSVSCKYLCCVLYLRLWRTLPSTKYLSHNFNDVMNQWRIHDFLDGGANFKRAPTYWLTNSRRKLHGKRRILGRGSVPPRSAYANLLKKQ